MTFSVAGFLGVLRVKSSVQFSLSDIMFGHINI